MILDAPAVYESDRLERVSTQADLAYPRLLGIADDWGRAEWNPRKILARAFPKRPSIRESDVRRWLHEYDAVRSPKDPTGPGLLRRYSHGGVEYFEWWAWKGVPPSKRHFMRCPPPPWADPAESAVWEKSRFHRTAKRRAKHLNKEAGENRKSEEMQPERVISEPLLFRQVPAVPAVNNDPPSPLLAQGDGPEPARETPAERRIRIWWIAIGGHPNRTDRRHVREALLAGHSEDVIREQISERVRDELIRQGKFDHNKPWPPEVDVA